ncbi:hypothetical protein RY831_28835 [Noviherbaspirillum sp. CPCC 100848]|uniref:Uncharacterized protein n=1 Tax=Noviherbaspirillum album TaxID=3080276 RepID=A0ABU6JHN4_9BURK|nr:hypothetical protein [Noviherbaspirillum sp. CPCC 100848]MEC4723169.1 hypothetical protein [Noviherbaspirillum sp. CPCC 100848]
MALSFDHNKLPTCCGVGLVPGHPHTACQVCHAQFDTQKLSNEIMQLRRASAAGNLKEAVV